MRDCSFPPNAMIAGSRSRLCSCSLLCLAFSRSTTAFPLLCLCSTVIRLFHPLFRGSLDFLYLLSLRLRFRNRNGSGRRLSGLERLRRFR